MALSCQLSCSVLPLHINVYNAHTANVYERIYCIRSIARNDGEKSGEMEIWDSSNWRIYLKEI